MYKSNTSQIRLSIGPIGRPSAGAGALPFFVSSPDVGSQRRATRRILRRVDASDAPIHIPLSSIIQKRNYLNIRRNKPLNIIHAEGVNFPIIFV